MSLRKIVVPLIHIFVWSFYISLPFFTKPHAVELSEDYFFKTHIIISAWAVSLFYFNYFIALPWFFSHKKVFLYLISIIFFTVGVIILSKVVVYILYSDTFYHEFKFRGFFMMRVIPAFLASSALCYYAKFQATEIARANAELASLKSQINPHFLFNTLNGIYGLALAKSDLTADSISRLSNIMRYVITETDTDKVPLEKEILYLQNYIELQKLRLTKKTTTHFTLSGETRDKNIPPLLLICFIENAFKYGVSTEVETTIDIRMDASEQELTLFVKNQKNESTSEIIKSSGIGMVNVKKRLELIYGKNYSLEIQNEKKSFEVVLKIAFL